MTSMFTKAVAFAALALATGLAAQSPASAQSAPKYVADINWPKPLPDGWVLGGLGGLCVDANDHVLILNRQDVIAGDLNGGKLAPMMIEFDAAGNVVNSWGDNKIMDQRLHSCHFDKDGNVWVASAPSGMVQKFTHDGSKLLLQIGTKGKLDSADGTEKGKPLNTPGPTFFMPSGLDVDTNGDLYVSDGEGGGTNKRVAVFDASGKFLRQWVIDDMESVHCMHLANDGTVYVCNRQGASVRVYDKMGGLKRTIALPWTPVTAPANGAAPRQSGGSAVIVDFSPDRNQRMMFVVNQNNATVDIVERESGKKLGSFGRPGSFPGQFNQAHGMAVDSKGNVYVDENRGRRVHKFVPAS